MTISIRRATTHDQMLALFRARHAVYVEEEGSLQSHGDGILRDRFDLLPESANFVAIDGEAIIGGVRFSRWSPHGSPAAAYPEIAARSESPTVATGSRVFLRRAYRARRVGDALLDTGLSWAAASGARSVVAVGNPRAERFFRESGHDVLGPGGFDAQHGVPYIPLSLDLAAYPPRLWTLLREASRAWPEDLERLMLALGEEVTVSAGTEVVLLAGRLEVHRVSGERRTLEAFQLYSPVELRFCDALLRPIDGRF